MSKNVPSNYVRAENYVIHKAILKLCLKTHIDEAHEGKTTQIEILLQRRLQQKLISNKIEWRSVGI